MPPRDTIHGFVVSALEKAGWEITHDPYVIVFGEQHLLIDLAASEFKGVDESLIAAERGGQHIAVEVKSFIGASPVADLEHAIGQYVLYDLVINELEPNRVVFLAVSKQTYQDVLGQPLGRLVIHRLPLRLIVVDLEREEVMEWIAPNMGGLSANL